MSSRESWPTGARSATHKPFATNHKILKAPPGETAELPDPENGAVLARPAEQRVLQVSDAGN
jgi:hypothetical protein